MTRILVAEALGTALLALAVIGSGQMAWSLAAGNAALALLANAVATGLALYVLITVLAPVSGAHFNPAVSLFFALSGQLAWRSLPAFALAQAAGAVAGAWLTHAVFGLPLLQISQTARSSGHLWASEVVATFGLVLTIAGGLRAAPAQVPALVAAYVGAAYWFTSSSAFANPALAIGRMMTDTFAGIAPASVPAYIGAEGVGALLAAAVLPWLFQGRREQAGD